MSDPFSGRMMIDGKCVPFSFPVHKPSCAVIAALSERITALESTVTRWREAFREYGRHQAWCESICMEAPRCTCEYRDVLRIGTNADSQLEPEGGR